MRSHVALALGLLSQARLTYTMHFYPMTEVVLEKLSDPDADLKNAFVRLLTHSHFVHFLATGF